MSRSVEIDRLRTSIPSPRLSLDFEIRPRIVSRKEWLRLTPAERLERFAKSNIAPRGHPAFRTVQKDEVPASPAARSPGRESTPGLLNKEPDLQARAAKIRRAIQQHVESEALTKQPSQPNDSSVLARQRKVPKLATRQLSSSNMITQGRVMARSVSQAFRAGRRPSALDREPTPFSGSQQFQTGSKSTLNAAQERYVDPSNSPQRFRVGSIQRKAVPVIPSEPENTARPTIIRSPGARRALAPLSTNQKPSQVDHQTVMDRGKKKVAEFRTKVKKTIEIWQAKDS